MGLVPFGLVTTSRFGCRLAEGFSKAGHRLVLVGVGIDDQNAPVGSVTPDEVQDFLGMTRVWWR